MEKLLSQNINRIWSSLIIDEFLKNSITQFYLSPGMRNAPLIAAMAHLNYFVKNLSVITCMDERGAAYRALGYGKSTGLPAVLVCTSGTAMANYFPAIIEAKKSNIPMIILSADRPPELTFCDDNQTIDQTNFFNKFIQGEVSLGTPSLDISPVALTSTLSNLIYKSLYPQKGPVHFNCAFRGPLEDTIQEIPANYIELASHQMKRSTPTTQYFNTMSVLDEKTLDTIKTILEKTKNGLLVIGNIPPYESRELLHEFILKLNWPTYFDVSSSLKYFFNLNDGALPTFEHPEFQQELISNPPDTLLHIGGRLTSKHYYDFLKEVPEINLITLNSSGEKEDPSHHTKLRLNATINKTLHSLLKIFDENFTPSRKKISLDFETFAKKKIALIDEAPLTYPSITKAIIDYIPQNAILYIGNSTAIRSFDAYFTYTTKKNITIASNRGASGIEGFIASGAGFIDGTKKEIYLVLGDVSFIHDLNSLYFLKTLLFPLKIILINNDGGGIFTLLPIHKEKPVLDFITTPHGHTFKKIAENFDLSYIQATNKEEFYTGFQTLIKNETHTIFEVTIDKNTDKIIYDQLKTIKL